MKRISLFLITLIAWPASFLFASAFSGQITTILDPGDSPVGLVVGVFSDNFLSNIATANAGSASVGVLRNNGDTTFDYVTYPLGASPTAIALGDFNRDGVLDIITGSGTGVLLLLGNGDVTFQPAIPGPDGFPAISVAVGDLNGDGKLDVAATDGSALRVALGNGNGTFQPPQVVPAGANPSRVHAGDFNNDGKLDLVVANSSNNLSVVLGLGDGTFVFNGSSTFGVGGTTTSIAVGDFNLDGKSDLFVTYGAAPPNNSRVYLNNIVAGSTTVSFNLGFSPSVGDDSVAAVTQDLRRVGNFDVVTANQNPETVSVLLSHGDAAGTFDPAENVPVMSPAGSEPVAVAIEDIDNDFWVDVVTANPTTDSVTVFYGLNPPAGGYRINKRIRYLQSSASPPTPRPTQTFQLRAQALAGGFPTTSANFSFTGSSLPNPQTIIPGFTYIKSFTSIPLMDADFNDAAFNFSITTAAGTVTPSLSLAGSVYPVEVPTLTVPGGMWQGGALVIDSTIDNTITWNHFSEITSRDFINLNFDVFNAQFYSDVASVRIPAYSLPPDLSSFGILTFIKYRDRINPTAQVQDGRSGKFIETTFNIQTLPAPLLTITSITKLGNGHIQIVGQTTANRPLSIRAASDMNAHFATMNIIGSLTANAGGVFTFEDPNPGSRRFYRATLP